MWYSEKKIKNYEREFIFDEAHYENSFFRIIKPGKIIRYSKHIHSTTSKSISSFTLKINSLISSHSSNLYLTNVWPFSN